MPKPDRPRPLFPWRTAGPIRVASLAEAEGFLTAYPSAGGRWEIVSRIQLSVDGRDEEHVTLRDPVGGQTGVVRFALEPGDRREDGGEVGPPHLDDLLRRAAEFARASGPQHPGIVPRFPIPSAAFPNRIAVPLAILAVDQGRRGLYAPAKVVVLDFPAGTPHGIGDEATFDPEHWPPPRLGDWPPPGIRGVDSGQLQGMVIRFAGCWLRLLDRWSRGDRVHDSSGEAAEAYALLARLDPPGMIPVYQRLNPAFWQWFEDAPHRDAVTT